MDAKQMAEWSPQLGTEEEIAEIQRRLSSIPQLDLVSKTIVCFSSACGDKTGDKGRILIRSVSDNNVVGSPIAAINLDSESCDALLRNLVYLRLQFKALAKHRASKRY
ncbi:MAG: hypothetical protein P4L81_07450 [Candidatus Pacebacteria bacterium]|nr:hypothetical protein [Candidatus Paceibacterota bacterium]